MARRGGVDPVLEGGRDSDIVIPVMGPTKSGKSQFLNQLLSSPVFQVSAALVSCTAAVSSHPVLQAPIEYQQLNEMLKGRRVVLVDTPGFDDTNMGDEEILILISEWLTRSYRKGMLVGGVLYIHDITRQGSMSRSPTIFSKLCGEDAMDQVAIVTTKWDRLDDLQEGEDRLEELREGVWSTMLKGGAKVVRVCPSGHDRSLFPRHWEPWGIVHELVIAAETRKVEDRILHIQHEIVNERLLLPDTDAGRELHMSLDKLLKKARKLRKQAKRASKTGKGVELLQARQHEIEKVIAELDALDPPGLVIRAQRWFRGLNI